MKGFRETSEPLRKTNLRIVKNRNPPAGNSVEGFPCVYGSFFLMMIFGTVGGSPCCFMYSAISFGRPTGKPFFVQRPCHTRKNPQHEPWAVLQGAAILAVLIVYIRDTVPIANVAVLGLGSFHCGVGLFLGQSVERGACAVGKNWQPDAKVQKFDFVRKMPPFLQIRCWN